jgi:hypothetical protein
LKELLDIKTRISYLLGQASCFSEPGPMSGVWVLSQTANAKLEGLLKGLECEIARNARRAERRALWDAAQHYKRSNSWLEDLLPPEFLSLALQDLSSPSVTWQVLRHLCHHIRFNSRSQLGTTLRLKRCRTMAAGEIYFLSRQRAAHRDRQFVGEMLSAIRQAV